MPPKKVIELDFIHLELHPEYLISTIKEGVFFDFEHLDKIAEICSDFYGEESFVSIADRKYDYSLNPFCLMETHYIPNILGIAVVCHSESSFNAATFESKFYKNKFRVFKTMDESLNWSKTLHKTENKEKRIVDN